MGIILKLAIHDLIQRKQRTIGYIIAIILVTGMLTAFFMGMASYQKYYTDSVREDENWEAKLEDVAYKNVEKIRKNKEIKHIGVIKNIGVSEENYSEYEGTEIYYVLKAYDKKAMELSKFSLVEGTYPKDETEIVIREYSAEIGDIIPITINAEKKEYRVVGTINESSIDVELETMSRIKEPVITYLDEDKLNSDDMLELNLVTKNIEDIKTTMKKIQEQLGRDENEKIQYNEQLLGYSGVEVRDDTVEKDFQQKKETIQIILWVMIFALAFIMLYSIFYLSTLENKKLYASFLSFGMRKKQIFTMIIIQLLILIIISIPIGVILGIGIWNFIGIFIDYLLQSYQQIGKEILNTISWKEFVTLGREISPKIIIQAIISVILILVLSVVKPLINIRKLTPIEQIRANTMKKNSNKKSKMAVFYKKIFGIEGEMAYYNKKRNTFQYTAILGVCITMVVCANMLYGYIFILYQGMNKSGNGSKSSYQILVNEKSGEEIVEQKIKDWKKQGLISKGYGKVSGFVKLLTIDKQHMSKQTLDLMEKGVLQFFTSQKLDSSDEFKMNVEISSYDKQTNREYLSKAGITELKNGECILFDCNTTENKYYKNFPMTNYKPGDKIELKDFKLDIQDSRFNYEIQTEDQTPIILTIKAVLQEVPINSNNSLNLIVNRETMDSSRLIYNIYSEKPEKLNNEIEELEKDGRFQITESWKQQRMVDYIMQINEIVVYSVSVLLALIVVLQMTVVFRNSINMRQKEFAMLQSLGMSRKQIYKMLNIENLLYCIEVAIYSTIISILLLFLMHIKINESQIEIFKLPISIMTTSVLTISGLIFIINSFFRRKIKKENIMENMK